MPSAGKYLIDDVITNQNYDLLQKIISLIVIALFVQAITSYALLYVLGIRAQKNIAEIRTAFFYKLTHLPLSFFKNSRSGKLTSIVLSDFESIRVLLGGGLVQILGGSLSIILAFTLMALLNIKLTAIISLPILIFSVFLFVIYKKQKSAFKQRNIIRSNTAANLTEAFRGIKIIKGFESNQYTTSILKNDFLSLYESVKKTMLSNNFLVSSGIFFIGVTSTLLMWYGSVMTINNELTIGELTTFTMYLGFLIAPFYQITKISSQFTEAKASIERINDILKQENEIENELNPAIKINGSIEFKNVSFNYGDTVIINNISFSIKPNSITAIIGKSGAGKSTLTELIASFYQPHSGDILIDNTPLNLINLKSYRQQLGFVFQETYLFNGSIKDNILLAAPNATDSELNDALQQANTFEFIDELSNGIHTNIGENGIKLSSGQKQRIAIARAFLANPKIIILDEATSNLDVTNEKLITESIRNLMHNRTVIVIAHRLNTIINSDQIILLDNGEIIEQGTHDELMNKKGKYHYLYNSY
jgi:ABC-type bacteriocin/lantibiotic exporter with double-glycine peptidase domain